METKRKAYTTPHTERVILKELLLDDENPSWLITWTQEDGTANAKETPAEPPAAPTDSIDDGPSAYEWISHRKSIWDAWD